MPETWTNTSQKLLRIDFGVLAGSKFKVQKGMSQSKFDFLYCRLKVRNEKIIKQIKITTIFVFSCFVVIKKVSIKCFINVIVKVWVRQVLRIAFNSVMGNLGFKLARLVLKPNFSLGQLNDSTYMIYIKDNIISNIWQNT